MFRAPILCLLLILVFAPHTGVAQELPDISDIPSVEGSDDTPPPVEETEAAPAISASGDTELDKLEETYVAELTVARKELGAKYLAALERLQTSLTKERKFDQALLVKQEGDRVRQLLDQPIRLSRPSDATAAYPPFTLQPKDALLKGKISLSDANVLFRWGKEGASAEWTLPDDMPPGEYEIILNRSCAEGEGGAFTISAGGQEIAGSIVGSGEWSDWSRNLAGVLRLGPAPMTLRITADSVTNFSLMNIRGVAVAQKGVWERIQSGEDIDLSGSAGAEDLDESGRRLRLSRYDDVTLSEDASLSLDGDSFHVVHGDKTYHLRLFFVDVPSDVADLSDLEQRENVQKEAAYFGITPEVSVKVGKLATTFVRRTLTGRKFSVLVSSETSPSGGEERNLAMVLIDGKFLSQALVENGLARIFGRTTNIPGGPSATEFLATLKVAESQARDQRKGAWGM